MSQLIAMRQRIKAVLTIKKIMGAMRLVSRSLHTRMNHARKPLGEYVASFDHFLSVLTRRMGNAVPEWLAGGQSDKKLYIIIGAQKGLCSSYNADLLYWMNAHKHLLCDEHAHVVVVGKKVADCAKSIGSSHLVSLPECTMAKIGHCAVSLQKIIEKAHPHFDKVEVISNYSHTFFSHRMRIVPIVPLEIKDYADTVTDVEVFDYESHDVIYQCAQRYLYVLLYKSLYESLLGEYAARFIATDNATRNADKSLVRMKMQYNKIRQAKITKEISELVGAYQ